MTPAHPHLVWDWNGTLLNDLSLIVAAYNVAFASSGGPTVTSDEHRVRFRRPIAEYYADVLGQAVDDEEFGRLSRIFHDAYRDGLTTCELAADARTAMASWPGSQSLLSMWFHEELVPTVHARGLTGHFLRVDGFVPVDGMRATVGGDSKAESLRRHLAELGVAGSSAVLIGDTVDDADAALAVGARAVLYSGGHSDPAVLRASGHPVADTLTEAVALAGELSFVGR
ncbi:HAD family hydrolase [Micromonospora vulcania]|uniref:HAD family hydrolase n=1 Tax=Micromonospora vulcania TaxID=1441873 RepID=A0ABW1GXA0_9ACTN